VFLHINNSKSNDLQRSENSQNCKGKRNKEVKRHGRTKRESLRKQRGLMTGDYKKWKSKGKLDQSKIEKELKR
jgi:hypothetical protein